MWVLHCGGSFASGIFQSKEAAEKVIEKYGLSGVLTEYPLDELLYEHCVANGLFVPKNDRQKSADFIGKFSSAHQVHHHYEAGQAVA